MKGRSGGGRKASCGAHELTPEARQDAVTVQACQVVHALIQSLVGLVFLVVLRCAPPRCVQAAHARCPMPGPAAPCWLSCRRVQPVLLLERCAASARRPGGR